MTSLTRPRGSLLLRLGSRKVSGFVIRGLGIIRATPISRDRRKNSIEMHWNSLITWLTSCLWVKALIRTIRYERKLRASYALQPTAARFSVRPSRRTQTPAVRSTAAVANLLSLIWRHWTPGYHDA